ncbi:[citrate (pro-3S)-lyase] ligase [Selenomonas sp. oral taxon 138]|uniref:[citrate (pro-3S)-lyase] ligase n=1 Tax=Selenomonas sp. oral taxon 138 TaxID=712532 RepID=UPI0002A2CCA7|nr:[citrate (pro-3S)-lyase] ligase [Selenomonas sp. oral taxon 138]EKX95474.1 [citrate (pro-3S)-lyase] ligase [Selenomonas sp. oral taxon 138 str. F0429]
MISTIYPSDRAGMARVRALLEKEDLRMDANLDYTCAVLDDAGAVIATGSCCGNTLRCFAVDGEHQGEGLLNEVLTHLIVVQQERGNAAVFLYTKGSAARFFRDLGFHEIARVSDTIVFLENRRWGFPDYLKQLQKESPSAAGTAAAIVMNANPFTLGHLYLVECAAAESDLLHLFIVSEDASLFPFAVRERLVRAGTAHLSNIVYHATGSYMISQATFPSYFQKDEDAVIRSHAQLDIAVFARIAAALSITRRYVGAEQASHVTSLYNETMLHDLPRAGIECRVIPRKEYGGAPISASTVRRAIQTRDMELLPALLPPTTLAFLQSEESAAIRKKIAEAADVIHY